MAASTERHLRLLRHRLDLPHPARSRVPPRAAGPGGRWLPPRFLPHRQRCRRRRPHLRQIRRRAGLEARARPSHHQNPVLFRRDRRRNRSLPRRPSRPDARSAPARGSIPLPAPSMPSPSTSPVKTNPLTTAIPRSPPSKTPAGIAPPFRSSPSISPPSKMSSSMPPPISSSSAASGLVSNTPGSTPRSKPLSSTGGRDTWLSMPPALAQAWLLSSTKLFPAQSSPSSSPRRASQTSPGGS